MGATGTATLNFGAFPGKVDASVVVTGQSSIVAGSRVEAWIDTGTATAEHSKDEHIIGCILLSITYGNIVASTGFTIFGFALDNARETDFDSSFRVIPKQAARLYGNWTIAWAWF